MKQLSNSLIIGKQELEAIQQKIVIDSNFRKNLAFQSHWWFFYIYMPHYILYESADFHKELFALTEDEKLKLAVIVAFRGCGKTSIMSNSYPIWAIVGKHKKKFPLIISDTEGQAQQILKNIKAEFESNELLIKDFGPFAVNDTWKSDSIVLPKYDARITALSVDGNVRGIKHKQYRPDLIICDDVERLAEVSNLDNRDKLYKWLVGDVIPSGDINTRIIIIGNLLHEDSLIMRLHNEIKAGERYGVFKSYKFLDNVGNALWTSKYPDQNAIQQEKLKCGNELIWQREYLLKIIPDNYSVISKDEIHYYEQLPSRNYYLATVVATDLAISERNKADKTAIIPMAIYHMNDEIYVYILNPIINKRMNHIATIEELKVLASIIGKGRCPKILVEKVAYQPALAEQLNSHGYHAQAIEIHGDKRSRLSAIAPMIAGGHVLFPAHGAEELVNQLINFGSERYDDLADALSLGVNQAIETYNHMPQIRILG